MSLWLLHFDEELLQKMADDKTLVNQLGKKTVLQDDRRAKALKKSLERLREPKTESRELSIIFSLDCALSVLQCYGTGCFARILQVVVTAWCFTPSQPVRLYQGSICKSQV